MKRLFFAVVVMGLLFGSAALLCAQPDLVDADCAKCHPGEVTDVAGRGAAHKSAVGCLDCHIEHPPLGSEAIPACSMCHDPADQPHFALEDCGKCHYPHYPLEIDLASVGEVKTVCLTCHDTQGKELVTYPSKHSELDCVECHNEHGKFLTCNNCHDGHSEEMVYTDCLMCHQPHMPTVVHYEEKTPSSFCGSCHDAVAAKLVADTSKHHELSCTYCHKAEHKMVPECTSCHGVPHSKDIHSKFPSCLDCHSDPHALGD